MTLKPKNSQRIRRNTTLHSPSRTAQGGSAETMRWIRWRLLGARPTDEQIFEMTGIRADDPNLEIYLRIYDESCFSQDKDSLGQIRRRMLGLVR